MIGFTRMTAGVRLTALSDQLEATPDNKLTNVFGAGVLPAGTVVLKYNGASFDQYAWNGNVWSPNGNATLSPGEGVFVQNNSGSAFTITFVGLVPEGHLIKSLPMGYSMVGSMVPQSGGISSALGYVPTDSDTVLIWDPVKQEYSASFMYIDDFGWTDGLSEYPTEPAIGIGQGFLLYNAAASARSWTRDVSVCQ